MKEKALTTLSQRIIFLCGVSLIVALFVPLWQIELNAPQYPEGLVLKMYPDKLAGNVETVNGLNHYIGMKTLHSEDFVEFTVLPYIISFFGASCFLVAFLKRKKLLQLLFALFISFGIVSMVDFWRWGYSYGHDLDPNAAIQVPGMAYQPPLIGFKQLLNVGAYSIPDIGGIIFVGVGLLLLGTIIMESRKKTEPASAPVKKVVGAVALVLLVSGLTSCGDPGPQPVKYGVDACSYCGMSFADNRFGAEIITKKGKVFKFDDMHCLLSFRRTNTVDNAEIKETYLINFSEPHDFIPAAKAFLFKSAEFRTPMAGNIASFSDRVKLKDAFQKFKGEELTWEEFLSR